MTAGFRTYRFSRPSQWQRCLLHGLDVSEAAVTLTARLSPVAAPIGARAVVTVVAAGRDGRPLWRVSSGGRAYFVRLNEFDGAETTVDIDELLASGTRWIVDPRWLWTFAPGGSNVRRYELATLEPDLSKTLHGSILDIASDGRQGVWLLTESGDRSHELVHIDCEGRTKRRLPVPPQACRPAQIGSVDRGRQLAILAAEGRRLVIFDVRQESVTRVLDTANVAEGLTVTRMAADAAQRVALWGNAAGVGPCLFILDASADTIDGPLVPRFLGSKTLAAPLMVTDLAVSTSNAWLATPQGLWTLAAGGPDATGAAGTLLTPALMSPESYSDRGWLRAELDIDLPRGAVIEASFGTTKEDSVAAQLRTIAEDASASVEHRQQQIWSLLEHPPGRTFTVARPTTPGFPVTLPLFDARERWLWLRLRLMSPAGTAGPVLRALRVLYPDASIDHYLPATFKGKDNDPNSVLRRLVGVLESTTQRIDESIASIGAHLQADTAPDAWLDYLARWVDLPWDDGLGEEAKRNILRHASEILEHRGTRRGLETLLTALLGDGGSARVSDITVDRPVVPIGGNGRRGAPLPLILTGASPRIATLGVKAVLGRARIRCSAGDIDPLRAIVPTVVVRIAADVATAAALKPILPGVLAQYLPAGIALRLRWQTTPFADLLEAEGMYLDADGPGRLGATSRIGRTRLDGRTARRLADTGVDTDLRLN